MKVKKVSLSIVILLIAIINTVSLLSEAWAVEKITSVSKEKALPGEKITIDIDISKIEYQNFKIEISNNLNIGEGEVEEEEGVDIKTSTSNKLVLNADKESGINTISINYTMPEQETNVKFTINVIKLEEKPIIAQNIVDNEIVNEVIGTETVETDSVEEEIVVNVSKNNVDLSANNSTLGNLVGNMVMGNEITNEMNPDGFNDKEMNDKDLLDAVKDKEGMLKQEKEFASMKDMMQKMENELTEANNKISSLQNTVTYQGSQNNYLEELKVTGYEFKNTFKKTTTTYFMEVSSDIEKVTVTATPEDSSAIVTIYGNTDLKTGKNKVIITVTADDGSERTYRIYVTKK